MATLSNVSVTSVKGTTAIAPGENYTLKFTLTKTSGEMGFTGVKCNLFALVNGQYYFMSKAVTQNVSFGSGNSVTYTLQMTSLRRGEACTSPYQLITGTNVFDYLASNNLRSVTMKVMVAPISGMAGMVISPMESTVSGLAAMRERINPTFSKFSFVRCDAAGTVNDEGERLLSTVKLSFLNNAYSEFTLTLTLYSVNGSTQTAVTTITIPSSDSRMAQLVTGITNSTLFTASFTVAKGTTYLLKGTLSSSLENASASCNIAKSFANMHLSAATNGGVAFGSFSSSTNASPKFECNYPALFYNTATISSWLSVGGAFAVTGTAGLNGGVNTLNMLWQNITLASGITSPGTWGGGRLRVGKIGTHVYVNGSVNAASGALLGTIPAGYRPASHNFYSIRPCGGARIARIYVNPNGQLYLEWVRNLSDGKEYTTAVWVDCNFDYFMS